MKALVTLTTWKQVENLTTWKKFEADEEFKYQFEADNLSEAELKVLTSFPASMCIGYSIKMANNAFICDAVKDYWFDDYAKEEIMDIFGTVKPTDEQIVAHKIACVKKRISDEIAVKEGRKRWVEGYNGDMYLVDVV